jgi:glutathione S-transferase
MSAFIVYSIPGSPFGRTVLATLEEKGAPYRLCAVTPGTHRAPPHILRHPFGRIPVLDHDGFTLYETQAIIRYLDRILPSPPLMPRDPKGVARMDQLLNINDWYQFLGGGNVIGFERIVGPKLRGSTPDEAAIAEAMPRVHVVFAELSRLLADQSYLTGAAPSLADIAIASHLDFLAQTPEWAALTDGRSNLVRWLDQMQARPSFIATTWDRVAASAVPA